jgi:arylsulfatase B
MQDVVTSPTTTFGMPPGEDTLAELLGRAGYARRACVGKWHLGLSSRQFLPLNQGFTDFYGHYNGALDYFTHKRFGELDWHRDLEASFDEGYTTGLLGDEAVRFIGEVSDQGPFFLYVPFNAPHSPMQAERVALDRYGFDPSKSRMENSSLPRGLQEGQPDYGDLGRGNDLRQTYAAMVSSMDEQFGRILEAIDDSGIRDNTLVLFHSDNGGTEEFGGSNLPLRGGKFSHWEGGVRVPAAIRWPARLRGGRREEAVMGCVDVFPTVAAAVGISGSSSDGADGVNLLGVLEGTADPEEDRILYLGAGAAVSGRWKRIEGGLYDLWEDPEETRNVADDHPEIIERLDAFIVAIEAQAGERFHLGPPKGPDWRPPENWTLTE